MLNKLKNLKTLSLFRGSGEQRGPGQHRAGPLGTILPILSIK